MSKHAGSSREFLDLRDESCPFTFIKTKVKLEEMGKGLLEVLFADESIARDVAKSVADEGYEVEAFESRGGWLLKIKRK
jgi:tRNA 2-thiouridine synthesizing protein A